MKKLIFPIISIILAGCSLWTKDEDRIRENLYDLKPIPDKYNTGTATGTKFNTISQSGNIQERVFITIRTDVSDPFYQISSYTEINLPDEVKIEDYDFSDHNFVIANSQRYPSNKKIIFNNCKFKGFRNDASSKGQSRVNCVFNHCEFTGNVSSAYIRLNDCKIGGFTSDAMNPLTDYHANNLYVYDILHEGNQKGSHLDGIQIYGDQRSRNNVVNEKWISNAETGNIHFDNVRFEIPSINFEGNTSYVNACVMFQLEFSDVDDVSFENLYVNGGGKWYPLYMDYGKNNERSIYGAWSHKNLRMKNAYVSDNFGKIFYPQLLEDAEIENVTHHSDLFVSSVWKDEKETAHIIVTNDTSRDQVLTVKTNLGVYEFKIPHCPSNWALGGERDGKTNPDEELVDGNGKPYTEYRWKDFPFDLDCRITGNPKFVVCYQGEKRIRYKSLDGKDHDWDEIKETKPVELSPL